MEKELQECIERDADELADRIFREDAILEKFRSAQKDGIPLGQILHAFQAGAFKAGYVQGVAAKITLVEEPESGAVH